MLGVKRLIEIISKKRGQLEKLKNSLHFWKRKPLLKITKVERTNRPNWYRVHFTNGGSILVAATSHKHAYYED